MAIQYFAHENVVTTQEKKVFNVANSEVRSFDDLQSFAYVFNLHIDQECKMSKNGLWWKSFKYDNQGRIVDTTHCIYDKKTNKVWVIYDDADRTGGVKNFARLNLFAIRQWNRLNGAA